MGDLISRQAAIDIVEFECGKWRGLAKTIIEEIGQLPSARPKGSGRMSAQELYKTIQNYIFEEKKLIENYEKDKGHSDYLLGRWASLLELENLLDKLDPEIFPDLTEDENDRF